MAGDLVTANGYNLQMRLEGRTVLVTGGASGLGGATTDMVVAAGGRVVIVDINEQTGYAKAARHGERARFQRTDVTSEEDVQRAVDTAVREFGRLDGVLNAAGIGVAERVLPREGPQPLAHFTRTIGINLIGTFNVIRLAAAAMALNDPLASGDSIPSHLRAGIYHEEQYNAVNCPEPTGCAIEIDNVQVYDAP
jgi:NAD(P)-dependent dehydrogenase (short-subunit alcohol dehydrogenase family)